jgi:hypothetical protein
MRRIGTEAPYRRALTAKPELGHKLYSVCCVGWRSRAEPAGHLQYRLPDSQFTGGFAACLPTTHRHRMDGEGSGGATCVTRLRPRTWTSNDGMRSLVVDRRPSLLQHGKSVRTKQVCTTRSVNHVHSKSGSIISRASAARLERSSVSHRESSKRRFPYGPFMRDNLAELQNLRRPIYKTANVRHGRRDKKYVGRRISMKTKESSSAVQISSWAVGIVGDTSQVAIRLNRCNPVLMSAAEARKIAAALNSEADAIRDLKRSAHRGSSTSVERGRNSA